MTDHAETRRAWATVDAAGVATSELRFVSRRRRHAVRVRRPGWRRAGAGVAALTAAATTTATMAAQLPVGATLLGVATAVVGLTGVSLRNRARSPRHTFRLLGEAVAAGLVAAGHARLAEAAVTSEPTPDGATVVIGGVDDDAAQLWADAFEELMGPLGTPRWLIATEHHAWRVPRPAATSKARATEFAGSFRRYVPGTRLIRAGTPEATEITLRAERDRPDPVVRSLRWSNPAADR